MYSPRAILTQEPAVVKAALLAVIAALITTGVITLSSDAVVAWGLALELVLGLLYVRPLTVTRSGLNELEQAMPTPAKRAAKKT